MSRDEAMEFVSSIYDSDRCSVHRFRVSQKRQATEQDKRTQFLVCAAFAYFSPTISAPRGHMFGRLRDRQISVDANGQCAHPTRRPMRMC